MNLLTIGKQLKLIRNFRRKTQTDVTTETGITQKILSNIELSKHSPTLQTLKKAGTFLGFDIAIIPHEIIRPIAHLQTLFKKGSTSEDITTKSLAFEALASSLSNESPRLIATVCCNEVSAGELYDVDGEVFLIAKEVGLWESGWIRLGKPLGMKVLCFNYDTAILSYVQSNTKVCIEPFNIVLTPVSGATEKTITISVGEYIYKDILKPLITPIQSLPAAFFMTNAEYMEMCDVRHGTVRQIAWIINNFSEEVAVRLTEISMALWLEGKQINLELMPVEPETFNVDFRHLTTRKLPSESDVNKTDSDIHSHLILFLNSALQKRVISLAILRFSRWNKQVHTSSAKYGS